MLQYPSVFIIVHWSHWKVTVSSTSLKPHKYAGTTQRMWSLQNKFSNIDGPMDDWTTPNLAASCWWNTLFCLHPDPVPRNQDFCRFNHHVPWWKRTCFTLTSAFSTASSFDHSFLDLSGSWTVSYGKKKYQNGQIHANHRTEWWFSLKRVYPQNSHIGHFWILHWNPACGKFHIAKRRQLLPRKVNSCVRSSLSVAGLWSIFNSKVRVWYVILVDSDL